MGFAPLNPSYALYAYHGRFGLPACRVDGGGGGEHLRHPARTDDHRTRPAQPADHLVVGLRDVPPDGRRAVPRGYPRDRRVLLDRDRYPGQRQVGQFLLLVDGLRLGDRRAPPDQPEGVQRVVVRPDVVQVVRDDLGRCRVAARRTT